MLAALLCSCASRDMRTAAGVLPGGCAVPGGEARLALTHTRGGDLLDARVARVAWAAGDSIVVSYDPALDLGISVLSASSYVHLRGGPGMPLRSGRIREIVPDARGAVWVRYVDAALGVSRLSATSVVHWDPAVEPLPGTSVRELFPEPADMGPPGDGTWAVTPYGLARFDPDTGAWTNFGTRPGAIPDLLRLIGADELLTDAIVNVRGLACGPDALWISTPGRVWRWDGRAFDRVPAGPVEGLSRLRFGTIAWIGGDLWAALADLDRRTVASVASWRPGKEAWTEYPLRPAGLKAPVDVGFAACGDRVFVLAREWYGHALAADVAGERLDRIDLR